MNPKVSVKVPKLSGFDKSFQNLFTMPVGTIVPCLVDEVIPNTRIHLKSAFNASLPPLASDTFMRCNLKVEAFFVPTRILYGGFESWLTGDKCYDAMDGEFVNVGIPMLVYDPADSSYFQSGKLADFLGVRSFSVSGNVPPQLNIFPFLAYHRIYDDWYRNVLVQTPLYNRDISANGSTGVPVLPFICLGSNGQTYRLDASFPDGVSLGSLRQRNFGADYFTTALPNAQLGNAKSIAFHVDANGDGSISVASIRAASSLQQFAERNQLAGVRLQDFVRANYGADLSSGVAQRAILLGSGEIPVYSKGIYQNANFDTSSMSVDYNNPFVDSVGAEFGSAVCTGQIELIKDFTAQEPGYVFVMCSLVPKVTYSSGISAMMRRYNSVNSQTDLATPILCNVGNEPIYVSELNGNLSNVSLYNPFGYQDRYGSFKSRYDELHGLVRDGQSLASFALQRQITGTPTIGTDFLQIPTDYLDQVSATSTAISQYGCWVDCYHSYKVAMPLPQFSIPSLQDPAYEHGVDVTVQVGGSRL